MKLLRKFFNGIGFVLFYSKELLLANLRVAYDALTPTHHMRPGVVAIPLEAETDLEILLLANLLTMTPGSISIDVATDRRTLYIHAMYIDDVESLRQEVKSRFEKRVLELLR